jgi:F-type H+-transporting ATPase subunit alpha
VRPAINSGLSVSRVGGAAQTKIMKKLGGGTRLALAQFRELEAFSQFASDLDDATRKQLERGQRITELMKQKQYAPLSVAEMGLSLYAAEKGYLDDVPVAEISAFETALRGFMHGSHAALLHKINEAGAYDDKIEAELKAAVEEFKRTGSW